MSVNKYTAHLLVKRNRKLQNAQHTSYQDSIQFISIVLTTETR